MATDQQGVVERYLDHIVAGEWDALADCLADDVVRVGPFGDTYTPREPYVAFLSGLMPQLSNYSMTVSRVIYAGRTAFAELSETMDVEGAPLETPEALIFELDEAHRISHIAIYIQHRPRAS